jgi:hypothetical protein
MEIVDYFEPLRKEAFWPNPSRGWVFSPQILPPSLPSCLHAGIQVVNSFSRESGIMGLFVVVLSVIVDGVQGRIIQLPCYQGLTAYKFYGSSFFTV